MAPAVPLTSLSPAFSTLATPGGGSPVSVPPVSVPPIPATGGMTTATPSPTASVAPPTPATPTIPNVSGAPSFVGKIQTAIPKATYATLQNRNGSVFNTTTNREYGSPQELASDLGVAPSQINWGQIAKAAPPAAASIQTTPSGVTVNGHTGSVMPPIPNTNAQDRLALQESPANVAGATTPTPPATPATPSITTSPEYEQDLAAYKASLALTPDQTANQQEQNALNSGLATDDANIEKAGGPMYGISGQEAAEKDATDARLTALQSNAALLQAQRTAAQTGALTQLQGYTSLSTPTPVSPGSSLVNPNTGQTETTAPPVPNYTSTTDAFGNPVIYNQVTGQGAPGSSTDGGTTLGGTSNPEAAIVAQQVHTATGSDATGAQFSDAYINLGDFPDTTGQKQAELYASQNGIPVLNADEGAKMVNIQNAYTNLSNIAAATKGLTANTPFLNIFKGLGNSVLGAGGNSAIDSYNAWRTAVINNVQALAGGSGSGLRINQAEIDTALNNDLPVITGAGADTSASAQGKINTLLKQMDTWRATLLGKGSDSDNTAGTSGSAAPGSTQYPGWNYQPQ